MRASKLEKDGEEGEGEEDGEGWEDGEDGEDRNWTIA